MTVNQICNHLWKYEHKPRSKYWYRTCGECGRMERNMPSWKSINPGWEKVWDTIPGFAKK